MSLSALDILAEKFDPDVKAAYQASGKNLPATAYQKMMQGYGIIHFRKNTNKLTAKLRSSQQTVDFGTMSYADVQLTPKMYYEALPVDDLQRLEQDINEISFIGTQIGEALARRRDQLFIDALAAATPGHEVVVGTTGLTYAKILEANRYYNALGVPKNQRHLLITAIGEEQILADDKFINRDYMDQQNIKFGTLDGFYALGFQWHVIEDMDEGGLPVDGNNVSCFAYHSRSVGVGLIQNIKIEVQRRNDILSNQVVGSFFGNSTSIDDNGIVEIVIDKTK